MISANFYPTMQTYANGEIERTDNIDNLYSNANVGNPYYLGYIEHDDFPKSFGVSIVDYSRGMSFKRIESNHSWGFCFNKNIYSTEGTTPPLGIIQDNNGHAGTGGDRYCFLNKIKMAQQNFVNTVTFTLRFMYIPTADIDDSGTTYFNQNYVFTYDSVTATIEQIKNMIDGTADVYSGWTRNNITYPALKYSDFNEYGLALYQSTDGTMTVAICISKVNIGDSGRYSYDSSTTVQSAVFPVFEHDYDDKHILASQGTGWQDNSTIAFHQNLGVIRPETNFGMTYDGQQYMFAPYPYDILVSDLPTYNMYNRSGLIKGQYFLQYYGITSDHVSLYAYAHYDLQDVYTMMLYYHKIYTGSIVFSKSYTTAITVATFNDHDGATGDRLSDDYANISSQLRDWQKPDTDISVNDYDPVDKPEYDPSGGGGDDNSETGDKIPNQFGRNVGVTSNFITQYLMTQGQISKLGEVLWTSWADDTVTMDMVENFYGKLHDATGSWNVSSALQFLVSCRMFPVSLATLVGTTATTSIPIGTGAFALQCGTSTEPTFFIANESVAVLNCGEIEVKRAFGDYRDFDNTNITAYLPYCGSVQLSPQDVVGKWIGCTYAIDLFDGSCKAFLYTLSGDDVGYQGAYYNVAIKEGQCGFLIPMSATQAGEVASRRKVDSYVDGSMLFNAGSTMIDGTMRIASGDGLGAIGADVGRLANLGFAYNTLSAQRMGRAGIAAPSIAGGSGFADFMQPASPYIQIRRSHYQMPIQYENSAAYPANAQKYGNLSQFTGFVQCKNVDVHGFACHEEERSAIKALLESGVYL